MHKPRSRQNFQKGAKVPRDDSNSDNVQVSPVWRVIV